MYMLLKGNCIPHFSYSPGLLHLWDVQCQNT